MGLGFRGRGWTGGKAALPGAGLGGAEGGQSPDLAQARSDSEPAASVALQCLARLESGHEPVRRARRQTGSLGDPRQRQPGMEGVERVEDGEDPAGDAATGTSRRLGMRAVVR